MLHRQSRIAEVTRGGTGKLRGDNLARYSKEKGFHFELWEKEGFPCRQGGEKTLTFAGCLLCHVHN